MMQTKFDMTDLPSHSGLYKIYGKASIDCITSIRAFL